MKTIDILAMLLVAFLYAISVGFMIGGICCIVFGAFNGLIFYPLFVGLILFLVGVSVWLALQRQ